jgi:hypothetical protein
MNYSRLLDEKNLQLLYQNNTETFYFQFFKSDRGFFLCFDEEVFGPYSSEVACVAKLGSEYLKERQGNYNKYVQIHRISKKWGAE